MQTINNYGREFAPNRSKRNLLMLYVICGLFICVGVGMIIAGLQGETDLITGGMVMTGFATFLLLLGHFFTSPLNVAYYVSSSGIILKQGKKILTIPYGELESITHLREEQSEEFILKLQNKLVDKQREDISEALEAKQEFNFGTMFQKTKDAFKKQAKDFEKYKFLSVAVAYSGSGRQRGPAKASSVDLPCDMVFILLKSGECYFISPLDIEGFISEVNRNKRA
ncbi:MAG: hypothetical protein HY840_09640 [Bacteroidetes bacterium]|nr:hypothetical protein [Bacteroidota bacterium]